MTSAMEKLIEKAGILMEALPYIRAFRGKTSSSSTAATRWSPQLAEGASPATSSS